MNTLLEILQTNLPTGARLEKTNETANRFKFDFCYNGDCVQYDICKAVAPGHEKTYVTRAIANCMAQIFLSAGKIENATYWLTVAAKGSMN